ncbi:hypothetical protein ACIQBJ_05970 [Kitasatospora sp. NPDC088391]|uniref:hypothetical protein n=1 Tax=Kitasatospora sp. NPDC088391 TaxID=3364074 RepID=UPI0038177330
MDGIDTRVEIYVGNVETLCVKPRMKGLTIRRPSADEAVECGRKFGLDEVRSLYLVSSGDFQGFVVGGRPSWREAVRELEDDTLFDFFGQEWPPGPEMTWGHVE